MTTIRLHNFVEGIEISSALYGLVQRVEAAAVEVKKTVSTWMSRAKDRSQLAESYSTFGCRRRINPDSQSS